MHVLVLTPEWPDHGAGGGIATTSRVLGRALAARGHRVTVVCPRGSGRSVSDGRVEVVACDLFPATTDPVLRQRSQHELADLCERIAPDVVQASEWKAHALEVARRGRLPTVTRLDTPTCLVEHLNATPPTQDSLWVAKAEREQAISSARVISPSRALAALAVSHWGLDRERIAVIPNPVDVEDTPATLSSGGPPVVCFVGRLETRKGIEVLMSALPGLLDRHEDLSVLLIGADQRDGPTQQAHRCALAPHAARVHLTGHVDRARVVERIAAASVVVLPSLWENFPNTALEAMAAGRPVVATRTGGFPDLITDGQNGLLVAPGDAADLERAVERVLADPGLARRLGRSALRRAQELAAPRTAAEVEQLYRTLIGS